ncbi:MAG: Exocyst complex component 5 [Cirrosporium novae-zelandiae]|nr:MAG: Exocyst complex component 5 [Cirrosporium novae-zelandiae]
MPGADNASLLSTSGRSVFSRGPSFTLDDFSNRDFIVKDFIETLSENATAPRRHSVPGPQAFDPKPLIRTFEAALSKLRDLSGDLELRENELSAAVRRAEAQHQSNAEILGQKLNQTIDSFQKLDVTLNGSTTDGYEAGGNAAVKIGEKLEEQEKQRRRAQDAKFLIQCWLEVSERGEMLSLEDLRHQATGDGKVRSAHIARQLLKISQRLDPISWSHSTVNGVATNGINGKNEKPKPNTRELIEKFLESLEQDLLQQFDEFYRKQNFEAMRECATVLYDFNEGSSVMSLFVNTHQFFIERSQLITEEVGGDAETWEKLADPDSEPPGVEPSLQSLVDEVKVVVQDESSIIKRAFPYYEQVLGRFLQRVFQQSIQQRLEMVLDKASSVSSLAFLRSLQAARSYINTLVEDLKSHGLTEHPESISSQTSLILDQQLDDLFVPYFVGSSYIEREKKNLEELYSSLLFKFTIFHSRRKKTPTTFMASLAKSGSEMLASARDAYMDRLDSSDLAPAQKRMLLRVAGLKDADSSKKQTEIEVCDEDGVLRISNTKRMLKWLAEGVGRGLELSGGNETPKDVSSLLNTLIAHMGNIYLETTLDAATDMATAQENIKNEPDFSYLPDLLPAITTMNLMLACINTVLLPLASSNITIRRDMEKATNLAINRMEDKVNAVLHHTIDAAIAWISRLLGNQKRTDYRPKDDGTWLEMLQTPTCLSIFTFLSRLHTLSLTSLPEHSPAILSLHTELAVGLRTLLLDHYRKFTVNAAGGLMVTKDLTKYVELLRSWNLDPAFQPSLEVLGEIGNLFVIGPDALKERLRGVGGQGQGGLGPWEKNDLRPFLLRREDASSAGVHLSDCPNSSSSSSAIASTSAVTVNTAKSTVVTSLGATSASQSQTTSQNPVTVTVVQTQVDSDATSTAASVSAIGTAATASSTAGSTTMDTGSDSPSSNVKATTEGVVGAVVGGLMIVTLIFWLWWRRRKTKKAVKPEDTEKKSQDSANDEFPPDRKDPVFVLDGNPINLELAGSSPAMELSGVLVESSIADLSVVSQSTPMNQSQRSDPISPISSNSAKSSPGPDGTRNVDRRRNRRVRNSSGNHVMSWMECAGENDGRLSPQIRSDNRWSSSTPGSGTVSPLTPDFQKSEFSEQDQHGENSDQGTMSQG